MIVFNKVTLRRGDKLLFKDGTFNLNAGGRVGIVGGNGAGKSSLFALLMNELVAEKGSIDIPPRWTVAHVAQEVEGTERSALDFAIDGDAELRALEAELAAAEAAEDGMEMARIYDEFARIDAYSAEARAADLLVGLGFAHEAHGRPVSSFSGGWRMRLNLARALMCRSDLLLLDEPTNHLDAESVAWLENFLKEYAGNVILVTHDRYFLDNVVNWVLELDRGRYYTYESNYSGYLEKKAKRLEQEEREEAGRQKAIQDELAWIRQSPKARQTKSKARIRAFDELVAAQENRSVGKAQILIQIPERLGGKVIEAQGLTKAYGDKLLFENLNFTLPPGGIVGVIGPNGAGKSTLFKLITGQEQPDSGTIEIGQTVKLGYVDQSRDDLDPNKNVWEEISDGLDVFRFGKQELGTRAYVGAFNFKGQDQQKKVGQLSGGERNRVHMAKMLKEGGNVLLLDEPTNDLDVETLRALEEALESFAGCAVVISHDRFFLDRLATHILAFEGNSHVEWFEGNFESYEEDKRRRLGDAADRPTRLAYKKLTR